MNDFSYHDFRVKTCNSWSKELEEKVDISKIIYIAFKRNDEKKLEAKTLYHLFELPRRSHHALDIK